MKPPQPAAGRGQRRVRTRLLVAGLAAALPLLLFRHVIQPYAVRGGSMEPTLYPGQSLVVEKVAYHFRRPRPGEIVVLQDPTEPTLDLVKRVVAVGGQVLEKRAGHYLVDGRVVAGPCPGDWPPWWSPPRTLAPDEIWVLGDNRCESRDSRLFGPVPLRLVRGRVLWVIRLPGGLAPGFTRTARPAPGSPWR